MATKICHWLLIAGLSATLAACSSSQTSSEDAEVDAAVPVEAGTDAVPTPPDVPPAPDAQDTTQDTSQATPSDSSQASTLDPAPADTPTGTPEAQPATPPVAEQQPPTEPAPSVIAQEPTSNQVQAEAPSVAQTEPQNTSTSHSDIPATYTVQQGDTLMKVAFENYGDLFKWRSILDANRDKIKDPNNIPAGTVLTLDSSVMPVNVARNGKQYLIKSGDTLGTISDDVYGTQRKWRRLWENNRELIHDPNRIFAGFYLYYTFTDQDRLEYEQLKGQNKAEPLAQAPGAGTGLPRTPASAK